MKKDINQYDDGGNRHGRWERYYDDGRLSHVITYINGMETGLNECYYRTGELNYRGMLLDGEDVGFWEEHWKKGSEYYYCILT